MLNEEVVEKLAGTLKAAGILYIADGKALLIQRGQDCDEPGTWGLPAGGIEEGESPEEAAIRESFEEVGHTPEKPLKQLAVTVKDGVEFTTFVCTGDNFEPVLNHESVGWQWVDFENLDRTGVIHPGLIALLNTVEVQMLWKAQLNELQLARAMRAGKLPSPQKYGKMWLWKMRITGTGMAYRSKDKEYTFRPPEKYLNADFLERCQGLPVIWEHTEGDTLDTQEFKQRIVGSVMLPYIEGTDVVGIHRIYDEEAAKELIAERLSTSPNIVFREGQADDKIQMEDGSVMLIEGDPGLADHLAICEVGVWDKGGDPRGVITETTGVVNIMAEKENDTAKQDSAEEAKKDSEAPAWFKVFADSVEARFGKLESKKDSEKEEEKKDAKKDSEEEKKDEEKKDAKKDSEKEEEKKDAKKDDDGNMPAEPVADSKKDSNGGMTNTERARLAELERMMQPLTDDDYNALANAQSRADSVAQAFGQQAASRPLPGERPLPYRRRLASALKSHSKEWSVVDLSKLDDTSFEIAERQIYKDAQQTAHSPALHAQEQGLRPIIKRYGGREITEWAGSISTFTRPFKMAARTMSIVKN